MSIEEQILIELREIKEALRVRPLHSEFCSKKEALMIMGWNGTPRAGEYRLREMRTKGIITNYGANRYSVAELQIASRQEIVFDTKTNKLIKAA